MFTRFTCKMFPHILRVSFLLTLSKPSIAASSINSPSYVGAVVEYHPVTEGDDGQMIAEANANNYRTIIKSAVTYNADIIVFPEFGLTSLPKDDNTGKDKIFTAKEYRDYYRDTASYIPRPNETVILCDTDSKYAKQSLQSISCAAREYKMYVVVNHHERQDCQKTSPCSPDGFLLYNTNVAFDRQGRVVGRYRKYNLLETESGTNVTQKPELSTFVTDFGVTFGQLIGLDALMEQPALNYRSNPNVTDIVLPGRLYEELPFLGSAQHHASWAYATDVNLLAAGYSDASTRSGGSGIYASRSGPVQLYNPSETTNALIAAKIRKLDRRYRPEGPIDGQLAVRRGAVHVFKQAEVPTIGVRADMPRPADFPGSLLRERYAREDLRPYATAELRPEQGSHITTLCDHELCCDFHVEVAYDQQIADTPGTERYRYRLAVFNGVRKLTNSTTIGLEVCSLISCTGDGIETCGSLHSNASNVVYPVSFNSLIITRRADLTKRSFHAPTTLVASSLKPLNSTDFAYLASGQKNNSLLMMYLVWPRRDVMTFGIYGRRFDRDGEEPTKAPSRANSIGVSVVLFLSMLLWSTGTRS